MTISDDRFDSDQAEGDQLVGSRSRGLRLAALAASGVLVIGVAACGDDGNSDDGADGGVSSEESDDRSEEGDDAGSSDDAEVDGSDEAEITTTTAVDPEEEVLEAYEHAFEVLEEAHNPPDPDHPGLEERWGGSALENTQTGLRDLQDNGVGRTFPVREDSVEIEGLQEDEATLISCFREEIQDLDLASGDPVGESDSAEGQMQIGMEQVAGSWKVISVEWQGEECE